MRTLNEAAMAYLWNAAWQAVLLWLVAEVSVGLLKSMRAAGTHRVWVGCLLLAVLLPALPLLSRVRAQTGTRRSVARTFVQEASAPILQAARAPATVVAPDAPTLGFDGLSPAVREGASAAHGAAWIAGGLRALRLLYLVSVLFALLKLGVGLSRTVALQRRARPAHLSADVQAVWDACCAGFGVRDVRLLSSADVVSPATMTLRRPVVVLPAGLHDASAEMAAAFCHELAHVRRADFRRNVLYELLAAPLFFHPAVRAVRRRLQETREQACDDLAAEFLAADSPDGRSAYAGSLLRLAESMTGSPAVTAGRALGVLEGDVLEKRVMNLIETKVKQARWRAAVSAACGVVLLAGACAVSARFGLRPVFAAGMKRMQPVVKVVAEASGRAVDVVATVRASAPLPEPPEPLPSAPEAMPVVVHADLPPIEEVSAPSLLSESALLQPEPLRAEMLEQKADAPPQKVTSSVTYSGTPPKYPEPGDLKPVSFKRGDTRFEPGDSITIDELRGTSDKVAEGNVYQVKGHYTLRSHDDALLAVSVTTSGASKTSGGSPSLNMSVNKGDGQFTLWLFMREHGQPHLSFYPSGGGNSFASLYFESGDGRAQAPAVNGAPGPAAMAAVQPAPAPKGWVLMGDAAEHYRTGVDPAMPHDGTPSAYLVSRTGDSFKGFGTLSQYFLGSAYLGKRVRLRGWVKCDSVARWAGLWMRVDVGKGSEQKTAAFDNMEPRSIKGSTGWKAYDVVLDVPKDASGIGMGILLDGPGEVWLSGVTVEVVSKAVPTTDVASTRASTVPAGPVNLGFGH